MFAPQYIGNSWIENLIDLLLMPVEQIIQIFYSNDNVGIIIPEIPYCAQIIYNDAFYNNKKSVEILKDLWQKMGCKKELNFDTMLSFIFHYGTMFWYKPKALLPLFNLHLCALDVPPEPLASDHTILHAIERLLVYIAWSEGYDFRIICPKIPYISSFTNNMIKNKIYYDLTNHYEDSRAYKLGRFLLAPPRLLKTGLRKIKSCLKNYGKLSNGAVERLKKKRLYYE